jgi:hypothetical protein
MRLVVLPLILLLVPIVTFARIAAAEDVLVVAKHIDQVENPRELEKLWKEVINTPVAKTVADAVVSLYTGCVGCTTVAINFINTNVVHFRDAGEEHVGAIQAPVGYTVCRAYVMSPSVNCNGTFTGSYRRADDPASGKIDGLHYYIVVPRPAAFGGRCWVEGTIVVTFINARADNPLWPKCAKSGEIAFHYGK